MGYIVSFILITTIFSIFMISIGIMTIKKKLYALLFKTIVIYALFVVFLIFQYLFSIHIRAFVLTFVSITIIGHLFIGYYLKYYEKSRHFDRYLHAFGSFSFSLFCYSILMQSISHYTGYVLSSKIYIAGFVATIGISLGCLFEIYEFILDSISHSNHQHGLIDTNFDLISDVIGAVIAGIVAMSISL